MVDEASHYFMTVALLPLDLKLRFKIQEQTSTRQQIIRHSMQSKLKQEGAYNGITTGVIFYPFTIGQRRRNV